ncbi:MAG: hypothetical protein FWE31_00670 [Firmicutes bacterium]|nr:hypothetical protein [Bacillota bacterium]
MASARRVINIFALTLIGLVVAIAGVVAVIIFWPSDWTFLGIGGVNERGVWTRFDSDEVADALAHRNLIIHSRHTPVEVRVRKFEQLDVQDNRGTILAFENARGLTFNQIHRTHIYLTETLVDGELFFKIYITAPTGIVTRDSRVVINLVSDEDEFTGQPYNFILDTGIHPVSFRADQEVEHIAIDELTLLSGTIGHVSFPTPPTQAFPFHISLNRLLVHSTRASVNIPTNVREEVLITSPIGHVTIGSVGIDGGAQGVVNVPGSREMNLSLGTVFGDINFDAATGSLRVTGQSYGVTGNVDMRTNLASLNATRIQERLDFFSNTASGVTIGRTDGEVNAEFASAGSMVITNSYNNVTVLSRSANLTIGGTGAQQGARGPVDINNRYGWTAVNFARDVLNYGEPTLDFAGFDGNITATRIVGVTTVTVGELQRNGRAVINLSFIQVRGVNNVIFHGSTPPGSEFGRVTVTLLTRLANDPAGPFDAFDFHAIHTAGARDFTGWPVLGNTGNTTIGVEIPNWNAQPGGMAWPVREGNSTRVLRIETSNTVVLRAARL